MGRSTLVTMEQYLTSAYSPDFDFVDDHVEERTLGERPHSGSSWFTYTVDRKNGAYASGLHRGCRPDRHAFGFPMSRCLEFSAAGKQAVADGLLRTSEPDILVPLAELFADAEE